MKKDKEDKIRKNQKKCTDVDGHIFGTIIKVGFVTVTMTFTTIFKINNLKKGSNISINKFFCNNTKFISKNYSISSLTCHTSRSISPTLLIQKCNFSNDTKKRKKSTLYTKTGDKGNSSLYNGERRPKTDVVFEVLGNQDELCAILGIARHYCEINDNGLHEIIAEIQSRLFDLGAAVATPVQTSSEDKKNYTTFSPLFTAQLEAHIDHLDSLLPPLNQFRIPSGGLSSVHLNHARTVCRRAERSVVPLVAAEQVDLEVGRYLNRLSDFLFAAARTAAHREGKEELLWRKASV